MEQEQILRVLRGVGAVITGSHVVYTSGMHGSAYINKDAVYPYTHIISRLCEEIAQRHLYDNVDVVVAPAVGGVILSTWTAHHLSVRSKREIFGVYAEKVPGTSRFALNRGYDKIVAGKNVLVVEDVLTTGGSAKAAVEAARACYGTVVAVAALCNRGGVTSEDLGMVPRLTALVTVSMSMHQAESCPLCAAGVPINTDVGKGREFLAAKK